MAKRRLTARRLAVTLARVCAENRCRDVFVFDVRKLSPVTDFFVLATGTSSRQMSAVADRVVQAGEELGQRPFGVEGTKGAEGAQAGRWVLIDYVDAVAHVFTEESRKYYDLELLWGDAPRVDWKKGWKPRQDEPPQP